MAKDKKAKFLLNAAFVVVVLLLIYVCFKYVIGLLMPFIIAAIIAFLLQPVIRGLVNRTHISQKVVAPVITTIFMLIVMSAIVIIIYRAISEIGSFVGRLPEWYSEMSPVVFDKIDGLFARITAVIPEQLQANIRDISTSFMSYIQSQLVVLSKDVLTWAANQAAALPSLLLTLIIIVVATFFSAGKVDRAKTFVKRQIPKQYQIISGELYRTFGRTVWKMIRAYAIIFVITFAELSLGLFIVGINYFLIIAAIIAVVDILPVVGTGTVLIPWGVIELILGNTGIGVGILVLYAIITVVRNIIEPRLVGKQIGLAPILTLLGMYVGLRLFGLLGLFLVPLLMILVKTANDLGAIKLWKPASEDAAAPEPAETPQEK